MAIFYLILALVLIVCLIITHEWGHYIVAKRNGVTAEEFAIFFGPSLYKRKTKSGMIFRLNCIPLGGYVKLKGEHDSDTGQGTYGAASLWAKTKIMLAGVTINLISGIFMLTVLCLIGMPQLFPNQFTVKSNEHIINKATLISSVIKGSPAAKAGLKSGDDIVALGPLGHIQSIIPTQTLQDLTKKYAGKKVEVEYTRNSALHTTSAILNPKSPHQTVYLGVEFNSIGIGASLIRYTWAAPIVALGFTKEVIVLSYQALVKVFQSIGGIFAGAATHNHAAREHAQTTATTQVASPFLLYIIVKDISSLGFYYMFFIVAYIALALAIINVLPIPALDGGRLWLTLIFHAAKKKLTAHTEELVNVVGMVCLLVLVTILTVAQIRMHTF